MDRLPGEEGYAPDADKASPPLSFDDALRSIKQNMSDAASTGDDADAKDTSNADDDSGDDDTLFDKKTDGADDAADEDADEPDKDKKADESDADKDKADDKTPPEDTKKKGGEEDKPETADKGDRASRHKGLQDKATRLDSIDEKYSDLGGVQGLEDFADLARSYKDPAKVDDFVAQIDELTPSHAAAIKTKIFYDCLDVPENQVEAFNDALIGISERGGIQLKAGDLIKTPAELEKVFAYVAYCLEDDRDDLMREVERVTNKIEFADGKKANADVAKPPVKDPEKTDESPDAVIRGLITDMVDYTATVLDDAVNPELERRGFTAQKGDPAEIKIAKTELTEIIRERAKQLVANTDLGNEVWGNVAALKNPGDKPPALIRNLNARYKTAIKATAADILSKIAPAMRGVKTDGGKGDSKPDSDKSDQGSETIITKDKQASLEGDDKSKVDYRTAKDPFGTALKQVRSKIQS